MEYPHDLFEDRDREWKSRVFAYAMIIVGTGVVVYGVIAQ